MEVGAEDFRRLYASLSDAGVRALKREELVDVARECYDAEVALRGLESEDGVAVEDDKEEVGELVEAAAFPSGQEANLARTLLDSAAIPCFLESERLALDGARLLVPTAFLEQAREVLQSEISDEELAAQAEAASEEDEPT
jgi:hypothetical protein